MSGKKEYKKTPIYVWTQKAERVSKGKRKSGDIVIGVPSGISIEQGYVERMVEK